MLQNTGTTADPENQNKKIMFKICAPLINCIS